MMMMIYYDDDKEDIKGGDLLVVHCCTLSHCHLGSEMIITEIQISIQRSSSGLLTSAWPSYI